jgi:hypothetical protein
LAQKDCVAELKIEHEKIMEGQEIFSDNNQFE